MLCLSFTLFSKGFFFTVHKGQGDKHSQCKATPEDALTLGTWVHAYGKGTDSGAALGCTYPTDQSSHQQLGIIKTNYEKSKMIH